MARPRPARGRAGRRRHHHGQSGGPPVARPRLGEPRTATAGGGALVGAGHGRLAGARPPDLCHPPAGAAPGAGRGGHGQQRPLRYERVGAGRGRERGRAAPAGGRLRRPCRRAVPAALRPRHPHYRLDARPRRSPGPRPRRGHRPVAPPPHPPHLASPPASTTPEARVSAGSKAGKPPSCRVARIAGPRRLRTKGADMIASILALLVMGLLVGIVAKAVVPGRDPGGLVVTSIIGVAGAVLGGFLASEVLNRSGTLGFNLYTFVVGLVGAVILLLIYHAVNGGFRGPRDHRRRTRDARPPRDAQSAAGDYRSSWYGTRSGIARFRGVHSRRGGDAASDRAAGRCASGAGEPAVPGSGPGAAGGRADPRDRVP